MFFFFLFFGKIPSEWMLATFITFLPDQLDSRSTPWELKNHRLEKAWLQGSGPYKAWQDQLSLCHSGGDMQIRFGVFFHSLYQSFTSLKPVFVPHSPPFCSDHTVHSLLFSPLRTTLLETSGHSHCSPPEVLQVILPFPEVWCSNLYAIHLLGYCHFCIKQSCHVSWLNSCHISFCLIGTFIDSSFMIRL